MKRDTCVGTCVGSFGKRSRNERAREQMGTREDTHTHSGSPAAQVLSGEGKGCESEDGKVGKY